jgi:hypothetical protein
MRRRGNLSAGNGQAWKEPRQRFIAMSIPRTTNGRKSCPSKRREEDPEPNSSRVDDGPLSEIVGSLPVSSPAALKHTVEPVRPIKAEGTRRCAAGGPNRLLETSSARGA